eukprot:jgi/Tetstr1/436236/TSEL_025080.t1
MLAPDAGANASAPMWAVELRTAHTRVVDECEAAVLEDLAGPLASALKLLPSKRSHAARAGCAAAGAEPASAMRRPTSKLSRITRTLHSMRKVQETLSHRIHTILTDPSVLVSLPKGSDGRPADVGLFGYGSIRGNTVAVDTTIAPILGVSSSDPTTALRAAERHKIQKYDEGVRNAAGMLRFVPFAVSEFGSLAPHAEAFLVELAKASRTHTGKKIGQLLYAWRRRFSLLIINMAHAANVLGGVAAAPAVVLAGQTSPPVVKWKLSRSRIGEGVLKI